MYFLFFLFYKWTAFNFNYSLILFLCEIWFKIKYKFTFSTGYNSSPERHDRFQMGLQNSIPPGIIFNKKFAQSQSFLIFFVSFCCSFYGAFIENVKWPGTGSPNRSNFQVPLLQIAQKQPNFRSVSVNFETKIQLVILFQTQSVFYLLYNIQYLDNDVWYFWLNMKNYLNWTDKNCNSFEVKFLNSSINKWK